MNGEYDKYSEHTVDCKCNKNSNLNRYVCPICLKTFVSEVFSSQWFCWRCGQKLTIIPQEDDMRNNYNVVIKNHPNLYKYLRGIGCGLGWYKLIKNLSDELEEYIVILKKEWNQNEYEYLPYAEDITAENGHLKFNLSTGTSNQIKQTIENYEKLSVNICEECGDLGIINNTGPQKCLCNACRKKINKLMNV